MESSRLGKYTIRGYLSYARRVIAFLLISLSFFIIIYSFIIPFTALYDEETYNPVAGIIVAIIPCFAGVVVGSKKDIEVNFDNSCFKIKKTIYRISYFESLIHYEELKYISIFQNYTSYYEARIFYDDNSYIQVFEIKNRNIALNWVINISNRLGVSLYDSLLDIYSDDKEAPFVSPKDREISTGVSQGVRPFWHSIIAALFYTISIFALYYFFIAFSNNDFKYAKGLDSLIYLFILAFMIGIRFSMVKDYLFDFKNKQLKKIYRVGFIEYGKWEIFNNFKHVTIHQKRLGEFHVNIWYNRNKNLNLGTYGIKEDAISVASKIAKHLRLDLLDTQEGGKKLISNR